MTQAAMDFTLSQDENFLAKCLQKKNIYVYPASEQFPLKERFRQAINDAKIDWGIISRNPITKKSETFGQLFERIYHEPLEPNTKGKKRAQSQSA